MMIVKLKTLAQNMHHRKNNSLLCFQVHPSIDLDLKIITFPPIRILELAMIITRYEPLRLTKILLTFSGAL